MNKNASPVDLNVRIWKKDTLLYNCADTGLILHAWENWLQDRQPLRVEVGGRTDTLTFPYQTVSTTWIQDIHRVTLDSIRPQRRVTLGDTLSVWVHMDSASPAPTRNVELYSSYSGLRNLGEYVISLHEGKSVQMKWVVTTTRPTEVDVRIHWYEFGENSLHVDLPR
jgi:hypothetical protein